MSGIFGKFYYNLENQVDIALLTGMSDMLKHRGPDGEGIYQKANIGLGVRLLSINSPENEIQPLYNEDQSIVAVLDGEIYEYSKWKYTLTNKGHRFGSPNKKEAVVHLYEEFGDNFAEKVYGEFAFAIWDKKQQKLILGRDNAGHIPLYYFAGKNGVSFASEVKAILKDKDYEKKVSLDGLVSFLTYTYVPWPDTIFEGIKHVPPGHIVIAHSGKVEAKPYWEFTYKRTKRQSEDYYAERLYELMDYAVRIRAEGIEPIGCYLSGGLDSSTLVGLLTKVSGKQVKTFTVGFKEATHNELPDAIITSKHFNTEHHEIIVDFEKAKDFLPKMIWYTDQPFFNSAAIATYYGAQLAKEHCKVVFDAHGPDQLIAGFPSYAALLRQKMKRDPLPDWFRKSTFGLFAKGINEYELNGGFFDNFKRKIVRVSKPFEQRIRIDRAIFGELEMRQLCIFDTKKLSDPYGFLPDFYSKVKDSDFLDKILYWEVLHMVHDDLMIKVDRMGMANSIETRIPLIDTKLMDFIGTIPSDLKMKGPLNDPILKYIMKKSVSELLPQHTLNKKKQGFSMPLERWMMENLKDFFREILLDSQTLNRGYFDKSYVKNLVERFYEHKDISYTKIWELVVFELWIRCFIDG